MLPSVKETLNHWHEEHTLLRCVPASSSDGRIFARSKFNELGDWLTCLTPDWNTGIWLRAICKGVLCCHVTELSSDMFKSLNPFLLSMLTVIKSSIFRLRDYHSGQFLLSSQEWKMQFRDPSHEACRLQFYQWSKLMTVRSYMKGPVEECVKSIFSHFLF